MMSMLGYPGQNKQIKHVDPEWPLMTSSAEIKLMRDKMLTKPPYKQNLFAGWLQIAGNYAEHRTITYVLLFITRSSNVISRSRPSKKHRSLLVMRATSGKHALWESHGSRITAPQRCLYWQECGTDCPITWVPSCAAGYPAHQCAGELCLWSKQTCPKGPAISAPKLQPGAIAKSS